MFVYTFLSMLLSTLLIFLGLRFRRLYGVVCVLGNFRFLVLGRDGNGIDQGAVIFHGADAEFIRFDLERQVHGHVRRIIVNDISRLLDRAIPGFCPGAARGNETVPSVAAWSFLMGTVRS